MRAIEEKHTSGTRVDERVQRFSELAFGIRMLLILMLAAGARLKVKSLSYRWFTHGRRALSLAKEGPD